MKRLTLFCQTSISHVICRNLLHCKRWPGKSAPTSLRHPPQQVPFGIFLKKSYFYIFFFQSHTSLCSHQMNLQVLLPNDSSVRISSQGETTLSPSDHNHSCLSNHTLGKTHHRKCFLLELWFRSNVLRKHCKTAEISKHRLQMWKHGFEIHS